MKKFKEHMKNRLLKQAVCVAAAAVICAAAIAVNAVTTSSITVNAETTNAATENAETASAVLSFESVGENDWQAVVTFPDWKGYTDNTLAMNSLYSFFGKVVILDNRKCKLKHRIFVVVVEIFKSLFTAFGDGFYALVQIELIHIITSFYLMFLYSKR